MFEEVESEHSFVSWLSQLVLAYLVPILVLGVVENLLNTGDKPAWEIFEYLFLGIVSFACAFFVSMVARQSAREGRWIWTVPMCIEIAVAGWGMVSEGVVSTVHALFVVSGPGQGEGSWAMVILTMPTWSCCCYSMFMWRRFRRTRRVLAGTDSAGGPHSRLSHL